MFSFWSGCKQEINVHQMIFFKCTNELDGHFYIIICIACQVKFVRMKTEIWHDMSCIVIMKNMKKEQRWWC